MEIRPFEPAFLPQAAALFDEKFKRLRQAVACIPSSLQESQPVMDRLADLTSQHPAVAALDGSRLVGYLAAWLVDDFRRAGRKTAYSPEWGHAALPGQEHLVYRTLYRLAADRWTASGCQMHAITLLRAITLRKIPGSGTGLAWRWCKPHLYPFSASVWV
jgi:hypothetical protein